MDKTLDMTLNMARGLLNLPDLIILGFIAINAISGFRHGVLRSIYGMAGKASALAASVFTSHSASPVIARSIVTPIIGDALSRQAKMFSAHEVLAGLRQTSEQAVVSMSESVAYAMLVVLFGVLFGWITSAVSKCLRYITKLKPISFLDSLAGGVTGAAVGAVLVALILIGIEWFAPITYTGLGWLSPQKVADTVLLARFMDILPVAI